MKARIGTLLQSASGIRGIVVPSDDHDAGEASVMLLDADGYPGTIVQSSTRDWHSVEPERRALKVVIMADMEGITGVPNEEAAVTPAEETSGVRTSAYAAACRAMTFDVLYAIAGARAAGATEIIVADTHWYDTNLSDEDFDVPIVRGSKAALAAMDGADVAMLIGWHAMAGAVAACLPHTYTDRIAKLTIDGQEVGEIGMLRRLIASYRVPVVLVTGDYAAHEEIGRDDWRSSPSTVVSKYVDAQGHVTHRQQADVRREIASQSFQGVRFYADEGNRHVPTSLIPHHPGQFEVWLRPGFEVEPDEETERTVMGAYRLRGLDIRKSYAAFQRFVDRLPEVAA